APDHHPPAARAAGPPAPAMRERVKEASPTPRPLSNPPPQAGEGRVGATESVRARAVPRGPSGKPLASPAVRRRAWDLGIALQFIPGTGPGGRITREDLDAYIAAPSAPPTAPALLRRDGIEEVPIIGLRRAIAEHLQLSKRH